MESAGVILSEAKKLGLSEVGILGLRKDFLNPNARSRPLPEGAKSVIVCLFPYYVGEFSHRNISRYAMLPDYHAVAGELLGALRKRLSAHYPGLWFGPFSDISPILEVRAAAAAGLGVTGKNGLLINPRYGSYTFIGELVTNGEFMPSGPYGAENGQCMGCGRCERLCPGGAIKNGEFIKESCLSYLTQKKTLNECEERRVAGGRCCWGCDVCADCCPHNASPAYSPVAGFYKDIRAVLDIDRLSISGLACEYKGEGIIRRNLGLLTKM